jgi:hypothetical protein
MVGALVVIVVSWTAWGVYLKSHLPAEAAYRDYGAMARVIREQEAPAPVIYFQAEAHALMFRVGQPAEVLLDWPDVREAVRGPRLVVVPSQLLPTFREALHDAQCTVLADTAQLAGGRHERPLTLLRVHRPSS